jgi:hypothetical protein
MSDSRRGFGLDIGFIVGNCSSLTGLHAPNITVTKAHVKYSLHSLTFN